jgi:hypothetical protein
LAVPHTRAGACHSVLREGADYKGFSRL